MTHTTLYEKVREKLIKLNMTQVELANYLNIDRKLLSNVLTGSTVSLRVEILLMEWLHDA